MSPGPTIKPLRKPVLNRLVAAIAGLAVIACLVLAVAIDDAPYAYALLHAAGCAAVAVLAWRRPWLAVLAAVLASVALAVLSIRQLLALPLHGSVEHEVYDQWTRRHEPFDLVVVYATAACLLVALGAVVVRLVRRRSGAVDPYTAVHAARGETLRRAEICHDP